MNKKLMVGNYLPSALAFGEIQKTVILEKQYTGVE
ncbi:hypothetical protein J2Z83_003585 [Virgibacillus natechei]|uniref:Uncharacterized protein n=1 Tax=Virgibacillus natechei TaxID=1216297 RepID=A0ABS4IKI4_9BACI|nr:hypothetical protein [Virgibacillus natechei]